MSPGFQSAGGPAYGPWPHRFVGAGMGGACDMSRTSISFGGAAAGAGGALLPFGAAGRPAPPVGAGAPLPLIRERNYCTMSRRIASQNSSSSLTPNLCPRSGIPVWDEREEFGVNPPQLRTAAACISLPTVDQPIASSNTKTWPCTSTPPSLLGTISS